MRAIATSRESARTTIFLLVGALVLSAGAHPARSQWPQWGGPKRNFYSDARGLVAKWPDEGPKKIWSRPLGEGYSSIAVDGGKLFTMYRQGDDEFIVCLDPADGKTVWEHKYAAAVPQGMETKFGRGPNATPTIFEGRIYTLGVSGVLHCLDQKTGNVVWSHDLVKEYGAKTPFFGFSSSPLAHKDRLIVAAGGPDTAVLAFQLTDGSLLWRKFDYGGESTGDIYSSPIPISVGKETHIALLAGTEVIGFDPADGEKRWSHPLVNQWKTNICTPVWSADGVLYISSGGDAGGRALRIKADGKGTKVEEVWSAPKAGMSQATVGKGGDFVYGSIGETPAFLTAVRLADGKIAWRERGFSRATVVFGDGKLIILDEDGNLALAAPTADKLNLLSKTQLLRNPAWTTPTLVGKTLYVRDKETIMALDLGKG